MKSQTLTRPLAARVADLPETTQEGKSVSLSPAVVQAAEAALAAGRTHYTDRPGILELRQRIVNMLASRYGIEISADEVTITCGATEARFVALKQLVEPGREIGCDRGGKAIAPAARLIGAEITANPTSTDRIGLVYLTPADAPERLESLLEIAVEQDAWIVWDTTPGPAEAGFHPAQNPDLAARTITIGSFSAAMPGWRVGWMAGSRVAARLRAFKQSMTICTTSVSQWAAQGLEVEA